MHERRSELRGFWWAAPVLLAGTLLLSAWLPAQSATSATTASQSEWEEALSILGESQNAEDTLPKDVELDASIVESERLVHRDDETRVYTWLTKENNICVGALMDGPNEIGVSSCVDFAVFSAHGLPISVNSVDGNVAVYLLPDGVDLSGVRSPYAQKTPNLLVGKPSEVASFSAVVMRKTGGTASEFTLLPVGDPGGYDR